MAPPATGRKSGTVSMGDADTFLLATALGLAGLPAAGRTRTSLILAAFEAGMPVAGVLGGPGPADSPAASRVTPQPRWPAWRPCWRCGPAGTKRPGQDEEEERQPWSAWPALLRRLATGEGTKLEDRAAASLMLLHGLPLSRVLRLTDGDAVAASTARSASGSATRPSLSPSPSPGCSPTSRRPARRQLAVSRPIPGPAAGLHHDARPPASHGPADARRTCRRAARARPARLFPALVAAEALGFHRSTTQRQRVAAGGTRASTPRA